MTHHTILLLAAIGAFDTAFRLWRAAGISRLRNGKCADSERGQKAKQIQCFHF